MKVCVFLIAACSLLLLEFPLSSGQDVEECPYNEVDVDCVNNCKTCEFVNNTCRVTDECEPGCDCKDGYLRNKFGYCIPRRFCDASKLLASNVEPPTQGGREVRNSGGCPNSENCIFSCLRRGFATGLCLGPRLEFCNCNTSTPVHAGQGTPGNREFTNSGGCPSTLNCIRSCKRRNFETGVCLGPRRDYCNCYSSSNSRNHGCPQRSLCEASCKRRRYSTGICIGDRRLDCKCSGKLD